MAITLAQLAKNSNDKLVQGFTNEIITDSYLLANMPFDDCLSSNGQSDLVYAYKRVITPASAAFRALNVEGAASQATIDRVTTNVAILNSTFTIDRVAAAAASDLLALDLEEAKNSIIRKFNATVISGDITQTGQQDGFNGLLKILAGSSTEKTSTVDIATAANLDANAMAFADQMDDFLSLLSGDPSCILVGRTMRNKLRGIARRIGKYTILPSEAGVRVEAWDGIPIVYLGDGAIATDDVFAVRFGLNDFHGITLSGGNAITVNPPDLTKAGAVKTGDAEFVCGCALKATKSAGVLHPKAAG